MVKWLSGSRTNGFQSRSTYQDFQTHHKASSLGEPGVAASHQNQNADVYSLGSLLFKPNFLPKTLIKFLKKRNSLQAWAIHTIYLSIWKLPNMFTVKKKVKKNVWKCLWLVIRIWRHLKNGPVLAQVASVRHSNVLPNAAPEIVASAEEPLTTRKISERRVQEMQLSTWPSATTIAVEKKTKPSEKKTAETSIDPKIAWKTGKHHGFPPFLRFTGRFTFSFHRFTPFRPFFESLVLSGWVSLTARSAASRSAELSGLACEEVPSFLDVKLHEIQKKQKNNHRPMGTSSSGSIHQGLCLKHGRCHDRLFVDSPHIGQVATHKGRWQNHPRPHRSVRIKTLEEIANWFFFVHCQVSSASFSWTKSDELDNPESLFEWDMTSTLSRNYRYAQHGFLKTSRDPCNSCTGVSGPMQRCTCNFQLPWSIPKFSAKSRGINWSGFNFSKLSLTHLVLTSYPFWHETCLVKSPRPSQFHPSNCFSTLLSFPNLWDVVHPFGLGWTYHHLWCSVQTSGHSLRISWIGTGSRLVVSWCSDPSFPDGTHGLVTCGVDCGEGKALAPTKVIQAHL